MYFIVAFFHQVSRDKWAIFAIFLALLHNRRVGWIKRRRRLGQASAPAGADPTFELNIRERRSYVGTESSSYQLNEISIQYNVVILNFDIGEKS